MDSCVRVLEDVERDLEGMLAEVRERVIREPDPRERACLLGKLAAYRCTLDRVREAREMLSLAEVSQAEARKEGAEAVFAPAGRR